MRHSISILVTIYSLCLLSESQAKSRRSIILSSPSICDKSHVKSQIKHTLDSFTSLALPSVSAIQSWTNTSSTTTTTSDSEQQTTVSTSTSIICDENVQSVANQINTHLTLINTHIKASTLYIQTCGYDSHPLTSDTGVQVDDVSSSAVRVVDILKPTFEQVSHLSIQFPLIANTCNATLIDLSTGLSSLIGSCSEQINLFDVGFFKLLAPQIDDLTSVGHHFAGFIGTFNS